MKCHDKEGERMPTEHEAIAQRLVRPFRHWAFRDRYGWPVERIIGRPITNVIRLILHTDIVQSCRSPNSVLHATQMRRDWRG